MTSEQESQPLQNEKIMGRGLFLFKGWGSNTWGKATGGKRGEGAQFTQTFFNSSY